MGGPGLAGIIHDLRTRRPDGQTRRRLPSWSTRWPPKPRRERRGQHKRGGKGVDKVGGREVATISQAIGKAWIYLRGGGKFIHVCRALPYLHHPSIIPPPLTPPHKGERYSAASQNPLPLVGRGKGWGWLHDAPILRPINRRRTAPCPACNEKRRPKAAFLQKIGRISPCAAVAARGCACRHPCRRGRISAWQPPPSWRRASSPKPCAAPGLSWALPSSA